jgi:cytochrome c-type biogenesis protein CcmH/NrfG
MMKPLVVALQAILGTALLVGCAAPGPQKPEVRPVLAIRDGGAKADDYYQLGRYYQSKDRYGDATQAYRKAIALDDRLAEAHSALGAMLALNRNFDAAFAELNRAVELDPSAAHLRNNLGYAYYLSGDAAKAAAVFEGAAALDPANVRTWNNLGLALAQLGEPERSAAAFVRATALASGNGAVRAGNAPSAVLPVATAAVVANPVPEVSPPLLTPIPEGPALLAQPLSLDALALESSAELVAALADPLATSSALLIERLDPVAFGAVILQTSPTGAVIELREADLVATDFAMLRIPADSSPALTLIPISAERSLEPGRQDAVVAIGEIIAPDVVLHPSPVEAAPLVAATMTVSGPVRIADAPSGAVVQGDMYVLEPTALPLTAAITAVGEPLRAAEAVTVASARETAISDVRTASPLMTAIVAASEPMSITERAASPAAAGTVLTQLPTAATIVEIAPHAVELKWASSTVMMRPAPVEAAPVAQDYRLEVANGNGVTGAARQVGMLLAAVGVPKARLTNQKPFAQTSTVVQHRPGFEVQATALSARFPGQPVTVETTRLRAGTDVRIVLGRDLPAHVALLDPAADARRAAATGH